MLVVSTPNYLHAPQTIAALEGGVHVMVEKPMAMNSAEAERGYLVGIALKQGRPLLSIDDSLAELALLAETAGIDVVRKTQQHIRQINPKTLIGSGKLREILDDVALCEAAVVIFDEELSPRHQRELEKQLGESVRLLDRSALILDIFAQLARTSEGALQLELAQY